MNKINTKYGQTYDKMLEDSILYEKQLLNILIKDKHLVEKFIESPISNNHFNYVHKKFIDAVIYVYNDNFLLSRQSYLNYLDNLVVSKIEKIKQESLFMEISFLDIDPNNYLMLIDKINDIYLRKNSINYVFSFQQDLDEKGTIYAINNLNENISQLVEEKKNNKLDIYQNINDYSEEFIQHLEGVISGEIKEEEILTCGIKEIDETMITGFAPGTLTLICADVSDFKSTMMLNIGVNIWKKGKNVLFVPLEMSRKQMYTKIISRETKIDSELIFKIKPLFQEHVKKIKEIQKLWKEYKSKFFIMKKGDRSSVSAIKREIEKHVDIFKPDLVVIDYIANLIPDKMRNGRNDLEIGDMLKDLRHMGDVLSFAVVSGAQLGREALKRVRKGGEISFNSEDIRGSHEYSADADNIYVQMPEPSNPNSRLQIFVVKARNGKKTFSNNKLKGVLEVRPEISLIKSIEEYLDVAAIGDVLKKVDNVDFDILDSEENDFSVF